MDLRATKNQQQREDEEAERLVRPAPKWKPPRRDRRRERVDTECDPDLQGETDPDLSKNYKDIGASVTERFLVAKSKKIPARNRDGEIVFISPETLTEKAGEYEKLKPDEAEAARQEKIKGKIRKKREKKREKKLLTKQVKREEKGQKAEKGKGEKPPKEAPEEGEDKPKEEGGDKPKEEAKGEDKPKEEEEKGTPSEADKAGIGAPKRRAASADERRDAATLVAETFPPEVAADILSQNLHPDDVQGLVSSFQASKSVPVGDMAKFAEGAKKIFETDPAKVKPPKTGKNAAGESVPFDQLQPDEQAETYRQHQMQVVAFSMAAQHKLTREMTMPSLTGVPRVPEAVAQKLAQATLGKASAPETVKDADGNDVKFSSLPPEDQEKVMASENAKRTEELAAEAYNEALESGAHVAIPDRVAKKLLKGLDPEAQKIAKGFLQANDYHEAKKKFLGGEEGISEYDTSDDILAGLDKASAWFQKRAAVYGDKEHSVTSSYRVKVLDQLRSLDEKKFQSVRGSLDQRDSKAFDKAQSAWEKKQKAYAKKQKAWDQSTQRSPEPKPPTDKPPVKPARYSMGRKPKELAAEGSALMDDLLSKVANSIPAARVARRHISTYEVSSAMDHSSDSPVARAIRQAVYHGIDPAKNYPAPHPGWSQPNQARTTEVDLEMILAAARDWLKTPVLAKEVPGLIKDQQYRAALDLGLKTSGFDRHLHPRYYNILLARLAGVPEDQTLTTLQASSTDLSQELRQVAVKLAKTDPSLAYDLVNIASRMARQSPATEPLEDFWMSREAVAEVCPECAVKMASLNIRQVKASAFFGSDFETLKTAAKGDKFKNLPKGWTQESLKKMWASLTGGAKHKVTACIKKMDGKVDDPGAFCASAKDRLEGSTKWRGEREARFSKLRSLVIRTAATDANARRTLMPILQALKDLG